MSLLPRSIWMNEWMNDLEFWCLPCQGRWNPSHPVVKEHPSPACLLHLKESILGLVEGDNRWQQRQQYWDLLFESAPLWILTASLEWLLCHSYDPTEMGKGCTSRTKTFRCQVFWNPANTKRGKGRCVLIPPDLWSSASWCLHINVFARSADSEPEELNLSL